MPGETVFYSKHLSDYKFVLLIAFSSDLSVLCHKTVRTPAGDTRSHYLRYLQFLTKVTQLFHYYSNVFNFLLMMILFAVFCSTISTTISAISAIMLQDVVKACKPNISDSTATKVSKVICVFAGAFSLLLVIASRYLDAGIVTVGWYNELSPNQALHFLSFLLCLIYSLLVILPCLILLSIQKLTFLLFCR